MAALNDVQALALKRVAYAYAVAFAPHVFKLVSLGASGYKWDNSIGRHNMAVDNAKMKISPAAIQRAKRADAAHQNGNESFPLFAISVLAAVVTRVDPTTLDSMTKYHLILRVLYNLVFIFNTSQGLAGIRTLTWGASAYTSISLLLSASKAVGKLGL